MRILSLVMLGLLLVCRPVHAADSGKPEPRFNDKERTAIATHYHALLREAELYAQYHESGKDKHDKKSSKSAKALPPGLQKKAAQGRLPPGWQRKLQIGEVLPPDILAVADPLPPALVATLPVGPAGTLTVHVDGQIIRVIEATRTIVDFFAL